MNDVTPAQDITDEMVDIAARAHAALEGYDWSEVSEAWQRRYPAIARVILEAGLAGRVVVDLPEPDDMDGDIPVWEVPDGEIRLGRIGNVPVINTPLGYPTVEQVERSALVLLAAAREARLAVFPKGGETND